jgi:hypothetical protein
MGVTHLARFDETKRLRQAEAHSVGRCRHDCARTSDATMSSYSSYRAL